MNLMKNSIFLGSLVSYPEYGGSRSLHLFHITRRHTPEGSIPYNHGRVNLECHMTYLFSLGLYNDADNSADFIASSDRIRG